MVPYCSSLLPRQDGGISQIQINRRFHQADVSPGPVDSINFIWSCFQFAIEDGPLISLSLQCCRLCECQSFDCIVFWELRSRATAQVHHPSLHWLSGCPQSPWLCTETDWGRGWWRTRARDRLQTLGRPPGGRAWRSCWLSHFHANSPNQVKTGLKIRMKSCLVWKIQKLWYLLKSTVCLLLNYCLELGPHNIHMNSMAIETSDFKYRPNLHSDYFHSFGVWRTEPGVVI